MVIAPFFPEYRPFIGSNGAKCVVVPPDLKDFKINFAEVEKHRGEYRLHFCGRTRLYPQSAIFLTGLDKRGWAQVGEWFDAANPAAEYDVYLSLKVDADGVLWFGEVVLCGTGRDCPEQRSVPIAQAAV